MALDGSLLRREMSTEPSQTMSTPLRPNYSISTALRSCLSTLFYLSIYRTGCIPDSPCPLIHFCGRVSIHLTCTLTNIQVVGSDNPQRTVHHLNAALHRVVWKPTRSNTSLNPSGPYGCTMNGISFRLSNPMQLQHRDGPCIHAKFNGAFISGNLKGMPTSSTPFSLILGASNTMYCCCIFAGSRLT